MKNIFYRKNNWNEELLKIGYKTFTKITKPLNR